MEWNIRSQKYEYYELSWFCMLIYFVIFEFILLDLFIKKGDKFMIKKKSI